jgi:hypothetical protein
MINHLISNKNHNSSSKIISTYKGKKYDLTEWNKLHSGGMVIDKANGKDLEDVWNNHGVGWHKSNRNVKKVLKKYLIE